MEWQLVSGAHCSRGRADEVDEVGHAGCFDALAGVLEADMAVALVGQQHSVAEPRPALAKRDKRKFYRSSPQRRKRRYCAEHLEAGAELEGSRPAQITTQASDSGKAG